MRDCNTCRFHVQGAHPAEVYLNATWKCSDCLSFGLCSWQPKTEDHKVRQAMIIAEIPSSSVRTGSDVGVLGAKSSNPKDILATDRVPLGLVPATALAHQALAHFDGAAKYTAWNWRTDKVSAMTYVHGILRHIEDWVHGEDYAIDSGVHHLGHACAGLNILLDAIETGTLIDDRPEVTAEVAALHERLRGTMRKIIEREKAKQSPSSEKG